MIRYPIPMVPGPVSVPEPVLAAAAVDYPSGDLEAEFLELYRHARQGLQALMETRNDVVIHTGEGMLVLWGAMKSVLRPGDRVLSLVTGVFGQGFADMARGLGCNVEVFELPHDATLGDIEPLVEIARRFQPRMITAVHCETPSGTLNPIERLGEVKRQCGDGLLLVDAVASIAGARVAVDDWEVDLCLGGAQKCLSAPPSMSFLSVSDAAWDAVGYVKYAGYDALLPFRHVLDDGWFPYTPNWQGLACLDTAVNLVLQEGLDRCIQRHDDVAAHCRRELARLGYRLFPRPDARPSPTVTTVYLPQQREWREFDTDLRRAGLAVGGGLGPLAGRVFRLGHMGSQAQRGIVDRALAVLAKV
ncbi:MAG: aminotransferase class V-fold PLP-dependent enzyme [Acidobacteriota bacterium]|jgi:aspartate aminotransferase-like enzyme|nr:aminotransferase class V-fold PLP-dependent enzyme [Acidobacteriota bacterium]